MKERNYGNVATLVMAVFTGLSFLAAFDPQADAIVACYFLGLALLVGVVYRK